MNGNTMTGYQRTVRASESEKVHATERVQVERKEYVMQLRENERGMFVRVTESMVTPNGSRHNTIIVPASGLDVFVSAFGKVMNASV